MRFPECKRLVHQVVSEQTKSEAKSVAIVSEMAREGKSFLSLVLALGYATLLSKRVLIFDAVMQTSGNALYQNRILGLEDKKEGSASETETSTPAGVIDLISTKTEDRIALDSTDFQIGGYINSRKPDYDLIIIDTCALSRASQKNMDPLIIAKQADRTILVTSHRTLDKELLTRINKEFRRWNISLLGTVFNSGARA